MWGVFAVAGSIETHGGPGIGHWAATSCDVAGPMLTCGAVLDEPTAGKRQEDMVQASLPCDTITCNTAMAACGKASGWHLVESAALAQHLLPCLLLLLMMMMMMMQKSQWHTQGGGGAGGVRNFAE